MASTPVRINALVELLAQHEAPALDRIRRKYPEHRDVLTVGTIMGHAERTTRPAVYLEVAIDGLQAAKKRIEPNLRRLRGRLQRATRVRFMGQVIGAIASAGMIAAVLGSWEKSVAITTATVNFAAVLCTMFAGHLEAPLHGGQGNLIDSFEALATTAVEAEEVIQALQAFRDEPADEPRILEQIARANAIAAKLRLAERMLWGR